MFHVLVWTIIALATAVASATITYGAKIRREYDEIQHGKRLIAYGIIAGIIAVFLLQYALESDAATEMTHGFQIAGLTLIGIGIAAFLQYRDDPFPVYRVFAWAILLLFVIGGLGLSVGLPLISQPLTV